MQVISYLIQVELTEGPGGAIGMYITDSYSGKGGTYKTASEESKKTDYSLWPLRAKRFATKEEAEAFIKEHEIPGAWVSESKREVNE